MSGELLKLRARIDMKLVVFQGGAPATVAVLGGHTSVLFSTVAAMVDHVPTGKLRALAVTARDRSEHLKGVPTMMASGVPDFDISQLFWASTRRRRHPKRQSTGQAPGSSAPRSYPT